MVMVMYFVYNKCIRMISLMHIVDIPRWSKLGLRLPSIAIASLQLVGHIVICIMISLDITVIDIIPLDNCSQVGLSLLTTWDQRTILQIRLPKITRESVDQISKGMGLKPIKEKGIVKKTQPSWLEIPRSRFNGTI